MCKFKSGLILKDRIYIGEGDSHTDMLEELKIKDNRKNAESLFVRAELYPANGDIFSDIDNWEFNVDQDIRPDWFVENYEKERFVKAVKEWANVHILIGKKNEKISQGTYYLKNCVDITCNNSTVKVCGNSTVEAWGNSTVKACNNSTVEACDNSTVKAWDNSTVEAWNNSTVKACGNSTVEACDNSTVTLPQSSYNKRENIIISENSTLKDCKTKTIYQSGDWKFVVVEGKNDET